MKKAILEEAIRIGDELLAKAESDEHGISWSTLSIDPDHNITWQESEDIYSGASGIVIFLLELSKKTNNIRYLDAAVEGMRWVEHYCQTNPTDNFTFFTGRTGVCYSLIKMFEATAQRKYLDEALAIASPCIAYLHSPPAGNDLLTGTAGTLLGLLHLHAATGEQWILEAINTSIGHLVDEAQCGRKGLYWDRSPFRIRGLCGFSHGAAGIGFAFLEAGYHLQNDALYWLAEQAFLYESQYYDQSIMNWPDFRVQLSDPTECQDYEREYLAGNFDLFTNGRDLNAWCHGAVGIGLSRLRFLQLMNQPSCHNEVEAAIAKTLNAQDDVSSPGSNFTLCHGHGGHADLFLEYYRLFKDRRYLSFAETIASAALDSKAKEKLYLPGIPVAGLPEDTSLFGGIAGIGYFYLRVLNPLRTPSILLPGLKRMVGRNTRSSPRRQRIISFDQIRRSIINKVFRRALFVAEEFFPEEIAKYLSANNTYSQTDEKEAFKELLGRLISSLPPGKRRCLTDIFSLELQRARIDESNASHFLLHIEEVIQTKEAQRLAGSEDELFLNQELSLNPRVEFKATEWNWSVADQTLWKDNIHLPPDTYNILLIPAAEAVVEESISSFSFMVLEAFRNAARVTAVMNEITRSFGHVGPEHKATIRHKIVEQIRTALVARILVSADGPGSHAGKFAPGLEFSRSF